MRKRLAGAHDGPSSSGPGGAIGESAKAKPTATIIWKAVFLAASLSALLSAAPYWDKTQVDDQDSKHQPSSLAAGTQNEVEIDEACRPYDDLYFSNLLALVQDMPLNGSLSASLCDADRRKNCKCKNPFHPVPQLPERVRNWREIHQMNTDLIEKNYTAGGVQPELVLYGDSITERLLGQMFGKGGKNMRDYTRITERLFTKQGGGSINGLPLGISSDEIPHLLYRLRNGEMPKTLRPKVWWFLIGTNDAGMGCSSDVVVAGNIRVAQEVRQQSASSDSPIVINSLFPRGGQALTAPRNALWRVLRNANAQLACYAAKTPGVHFVDLTDRFVEQQGDNAFIHRDMFVKDRVHISTNGSQVWEEFMVQKVRSLLNP